MRSSIMLASALAATALAKPVEKRDVIVTATDVVYTTDVVYVTAGQQAPSSAAPAPAAASGHRKHGHHHSHSPVAPASYSPAPASSSSEAPAPVPAPATSEAPAPAPTSEAPAYTPLASSSSSEAPAPEPTASSGGVASTYQQAVVDHHNYHRANHSAPAIAWDKEMADIAMSIAKTCVYAHNMTASKTSYGQNIAAGVGASDIGVTISDLFYNGEVSKFTGYGQSQPDMGNFEAWGHFSQIVWKGSTKVGCASWDCGSNLANFGGPNGIFTVCNYSPPGNFGGEYGANIGNSLGKSTVPGSYNVDTSAIGKSYCGATGQSIT